MAYQSFDDQRGASDSSSKLAKLCLPDLKGRTFLDLGCNEGFFCGYALQQGASKAVGIEKSTKFFESAKNRYPEAEFLNQSWDDAIPGKYDVVLFSSALHYSSRKAEMLKKIHGLLEPGGVLILECGVAPGEEMTEVETRRKVGTVMHPTRPLLMRYLENYSVTEIGPSVLQAGDPVPRYVYHCFRTALRTVVLLSAGAGLGKSTLAEGLFQEGRVSLDYMMHVFERDVIGEKKTSVHVSSLISRIEKDGRWAELLSFMGSYMTRIRRAERQTLILDGYILSHPVVQDWFCSYFRDVQIWELKPVARETPASDGSEIRLFEADPAVVEVVNPKLFKRRLDGTSFVLHPPGAPGRWSKAIWNVPDTGGKSRFSCELSLPHKGNPVEVGVIVALDGKPGALRSTEVRPGEYRTWTVDIGRVSGPAAVCIQTARAQSAASNAKSWLVLHSPRLHS